MARHVLVVMGTAGAGKTRIGTALADALEVPFIEGDTFHSADNIALMAAGIPLTDENRRGWLEALALQLRDARANGTSVVMTCSALKRRYRDILRSGDESIRFIMLDADPDVLLERLHSRAGHYMPASLLDSQLAALERPAPDENAWTFDAQRAPDVIVSDIVSQLRATEGAAAP